MGPVPMLFAPEDGRVLGQAVAAALGAPLSPLEEREFADGEFKSRALANVRGRDVYVLQSLHGDASRTPAEKLVRLLFLLGSLHDAGAARVTAVAPYLAFARKDQRSKSRDPVSTRYVAACLEAVGCDAVVTLDVHNRAAFENAFRCRAYDLPATGPLVEALARELPPGPVSVVAPDPGGLKRAERFRLALAARLGREVASAFVSKTRSEGRLGGGELAGDVAGTTALVVDDLVAGGHTLARAAHACRGHGADRVFAAATHGAFTDEADAVLAQGGLEALWVTDTIPGPRLRLAAARVRTVSVAPFVAEAIACLAADGDLEALSPP